MTRRHKREIIKVPANCIADIAKAHGNVTRQTVYNALAYRSFSDTAEHIRKEAVELYGGIVWKEA